MNLKSFGLCLGSALLLASSARAQNYTITLYNGQNGSGNVVMTYTGPMLNVTQNGTLVQGFVTNPATMQWNTPPIPLDGQAGSLNPCNVTLNNNGPNGEAVITCESEAPGTTNGVPLFSFCFQGVQWPMPVGTYNVDGAHFSSCGNYFVAHPQISGYGFAFAQLNSGSIVVAPAQGGTWSTRAPMPTARYSTGIGVVNGIIYVMGGTTSVTSSGSNIAALEAYDPTSNTWSAKAPMPTPRHSFGVSVVNGILYTVGGYAFSCLCSVPTVEAYDPRSDTWVTKAPMPSTRNGLVTGVVNGSIYAAGGNSPSSQYLATVEAYDPVSDTWSTKASMPTARYEPAAGVIDDVLYVVGGSYNGSISTLEGYDATTDTWSAKSPMPTPRYYLGSGILNELLYAVGGHSDSIALSSVEAYDPTTQSWTEVTPMPTPRLPAVAVVNGTLYAIGGYDYVHGMPLSTVEAFTPTTPGTAQLNGGNTLAGNQTVNGSVSATSFIGDGSGLTGIVAQTANTANFANTANYASTAGTAASATFAASAGDAMTLGGNLPSAFAPASGSSNYVAKSGDTMTGALNLPANGLIAGTNQFVLSGGNVGIGTTSPGAGLLWSQMGYPTLLHLQNSTGFNMAAVQATGTYHSAILYAEGRTAGCAECGSGGGLLGLADSAAASNSRILDIISWGGKMQFRRVSDDYTQQLAVPMTIDYTSNPNGNVGIGTHSPTAMLEVSGTAKFDSTVTFAPGQIFPGTGGGTIIGVTAGSGLSGGGSSGNVTLNNTGVLSITGGSGITSSGGQSPTLSLNTTFTDSRYAQLGASNNFTANQTVPNLIATGTVTGASGSFINLSGIGVIGNGGNFGMYGSSTGVGVRGSGGNTGVFGDGNTGVYGTSANGTAGIFEVTNNGKILSGKSNSVEVFGVANNGSVNTSGNLTASGSVVIGSGTPILKHLSIQVNPTFAALKAGTCATANFTLTGSVDGDTIALGVANGRMLGGGILDYFAWVSAADTITLRACNVDPNNPQKTAGSGLIRIDLWKH